MVLIKFDKPTAMIISGVQSAEPSENYIFQKRRRGTEIMP
jgi:hypothetical protein